MTSSPMAALQAPGLHPSTGILSDRPRLTQGPGVRWRTFSGEGPGAWAGWQRQGVCPWVVVGVWF
jgi:hypothetical protein